MYLISKDKKQQEINAINIFSSFKFPKDFLFSYSLDWSEKEQGEFYLPLYMSYKDEPVDVYGNFTVNFDKDGYVIYVSLWDEYEEIASYTKEQLEKYNKIEKSSETPFCTI